MTAKISDYDRQKLLYKTLEEWVKENMDNFYYATHEEPETMGFIKEEDVIGNFADSLYEKIDTVCLHCRDELNYGWCSDWDKR